MTQNALQAVAQIVQKRGITALNGFLESCRAFAREQTLSVAVFGRFKAGKSSFLNQLLGRPILPVGAIPVTSVVTEVEYGLHDCAEVIFKNGRSEQVEPERIGAFVSEKENPENVKNVLRVRVELDSMAPYREIRFVDTPGLESILEHNTEASLDWLPNTGLAIVAVAVDAPLSKHDVELIRKLGRYTPNISVLLTKVDLLDEPGRIDVEEFVRKQIARWDRPVGLYPHSTRPGFEQLRSHVEQNLLLRTQVEAHEYRATILQHKLETLLGECGLYLQLALKAAEHDESEREELRQKILGGTEALDDLHQSIRLTARHAAARSRSSFEEILRNDECALRQILLDQLEDKLASWKTLASAATGFEEWLRGTLECQIEGLSSKHQAEFVEPVARVRRHLSQALQDFRNRLSERALSCLGVPLRTSEMDLHVAEPNAPDVRVGKIFDHNWELLSFFLPMWVVREVVHKHFRRKVENAAFVNLSRLAAQWEQAVNTSISGLENEAIRRLDRLAATIKTLIASAPRETPGLQEDLLRLEELRSALMRGAK